MGEPIPPTPAYRDDPDAVSLHTTPDDYAYTDAPEPNLDLADSNLPPSYADSEASSAAAFATPIHHAPPAPTRTNHSSPSYKNGHPVVCTTLTLIDPLLDHDPQLLEKTIRANANIPPVQYLYILGTHKETIRNGDKKECTEVTDFRIVLNLSPYLHPNFSPSDTSTMALHTAENSEPTHRGSILKHQHRAPKPPSDTEAASAGPKPSLTEWTHRYCASSSRLRTFRLQRVVTGLDQGLLQHRLERLLRATNYRGHVSISFPVEDANLDIYSDALGNRWRLTSWIRWLFYLSFLWLLTWPLLFCATKRYAVVRAEWPFSAPRPGAGKVYTTVSEEAWVRRWEVALRRLVLDRWQGEVSEEVMRGVEARPEDPPMPGMLRTGLEGVDAAVGLLGHGLRVARAVRSGDFGGAVQGGWGYDC